MHHSIYARESSVPVFGPNTLDFISHSDAQTQRLGAKIATMLEPGDVVALVGDLGTGKTRWAQGICEGLGVQDRVVSPTFSLVNEYDGRLPVYHIDLYRLSKAVEVDTFGLEDYLYGDGVCLIEWADRIEEVLPNDYLVVALYHLEETKRRVVLQPQGQRFVPVLKAFKKAAFAPHQEQ